MHVVLTKLAPDDLKRMEIVHHGGAEHSLSTSTERVLHDWQQILVIQAANQFENLCHFCVLVMIIFTKTQANTTPSTSMNNSENA